MEGKQKEAYEGIMEIEARIREAGYGIDDDFDVDAWRDDLDNLSYAVEGE